MTLEAKLFDDLDAAAREAGEDLSRSAQTHLFDRLEWFRLVEKHSAPEGRLLAVRSRNATGSAWLFLSTAKGSAEPFSDCYCLRFATVVTGDPQEAVDELARRLRKAGISRLCLSPIGAEDPLVGALKRSHWLIRLSQTSVNWRVRTAGMSFEEYWASRPSRLRNTVKRRARAARLDIRIHPAFDEQAWRDYESVYEASWKQAEGSPDFMRALAQAEGQAGTLRLGLAYRDGRPVAAQFWLVEGGIATIHKLAHREDARQYSPGTILTAAMFRRAMEVDRVELIDFGTGGEGYKADWMSESVPLYTLTAYDLLSPNTLPGLARWLISKLVRRVRSQ
jgi:CelD/BcsL family acetyltransferase involved in cellulose biosynthesis